MYDDVVDRLTLKFAKEGNGGRAGERWEAERRSGEVE